VAEGTAVRKSSPVRSRLQIAATRPISIDMNEDSLAIFQALAELAGVNIIFDADFRSVRPIRLKLENVDVLDALDYLAIETRTFWEAVDSTTIMIAPDNQAKRRDFSNLLFQAIYFDNAAPRQVTESITALRTLLNMRYLANVTSVGAIGIIATPTQIALGQKIIADMKGRTSQTASRDVTLEVGNETGGVLRTRAARATAAAGTQPAVKAGKISVDFNASAHDAFERVAGMAGLQVVFDPRFKDSPAQPFAVNNVGTADALDFLSLQTRTFWVFLDASTIVVAPDSQAVRRDIQPRTQDVISFARTPTRVGVVELVTALRTLLNTREVDGSEKGIALNDTVDNVVLAQKIVEDLSR
jgi:hypothetical protein